MGIPTLTLIKTSVVCFYRRIFVTPRFKLLAKFFIGLLIAWLIAFLVASFLECGNHLLSLFSTASDYEVHCKNALPTGYGYVISDVIMDLMTLAMPVPMVSLLTLFVSSRQNYYPFRLLQPSYLTICFP